MSSSRLPDEVQEICARVDALSTADWSGLSVAERLAGLERLETAARRLRAVSHSVTGTLVGESPEVLGDKPHNALAAKLRITPVAARRRLREAEQLGQRMTLTGQPLPPLLEGTAAQWQAGVLDPEHLRVITSCMADLPADVPFDKRQWAEKFLAEKAAELRPDQLRQVAARLLAILNPDGALSDVDRARKRGITIGRQQSDGMSPISGWLSPELRATLDAVLGKLAAPGMCNPDSDAPRTDGSPTEDEITADRRSAAQRQHDGLLAACRALLASGRLGSHHGLPVTVVVTTTIDQLESAAGRAGTASGALLPMGDLIRMAAHAYHYLAIFDRHSECPLYLGRTRRTASAAQRIMLHAVDRGCTFPGCTVPGYLCEVDHVREWAAEGGPTDIDALTLVCGPHHRLKTGAGWTVRKRPDGRTEWIPPPQLHLDGGVNDYHHPERITPDGDPDRPPGPPHPGPS